MLRTTAAPTDSGSGPRRTVVAVETSGVSRDAAWRKTRYSTTDQPSRTDLKKEYAVAKTQSDLTKKNKEKKKKKEKKRTAS